MCSSGRGIKAGYLKKSYMQAWESNLIGRKAEESLAKPVPRRQGWRPMQIKPGKYVVDTFQEQISQLSVVVPNSGA